MSVRLKMKQQTECDQFGNTSTAEYAMIYTIYMPKLTEENSTSRVGVINMDLHSTSNRQHDANRFARYLLYQSSFIRQRTSVALSVFDLHPLLPPLPGGRKLVYREDDVLTTPIRADADKKKCGSDIT